MTTRLYGPLVINLDSRPDRLTQIADEFKKLNMSFIRLSASSDYKNPAIACMDSHCRCLEQYLHSIQSKDGEKEAVFVCEDDAQFNINKPNLDNHINEFLDSNADVLCLGYYADSPSPWSALFNRSKDIQTRVAYIVKRHFVKELLDIWRKLYVYVIQNPNPKTIQNQSSRLLNWYEQLYNNLPIKNKARDIYRGDQAWKILQQKYYFIIPKIRIAVQRPSYSDIEKHFVDYKV
jgi:hypothetical protein